MSGLDVIFDGRNLIRLFGGLVEVAKISVIALFFGILLGILFGVIRTSHNPLIRIIFKIYLEIIRIVPLLVLLFIFYYILPEVTGSDWSNITVSIVVFIFWISAEMSDLVRASLENVSKIQIESAKALGFNQRQLFFFVLLPQGLPSVIPATINLVTRVIKTTSLLLMIGVGEMIKIGTQIIENYTVKVPSASLWIYGFIFILYFILCYPLSRYSQYLERKLAIKQGGELVE